MTRCIHGDHEFPIEDETGAYCEEHGVTLLWNPPEFNWDDLLEEPGRRRRAGESAPGATPSGS
ncbi:hypothetical protein [Streptomyces sp. PanSC9]|uniref:hypothetical protein n=1 Tax=Streptomyces sp. PanSC9 TaxID=1520461 RepID=UPI000F47A016|nr:hypothetical protein [Streptomyces sp. PanSC9]ROP53257.1 hypothetical protein EDD94_2760 [Streptomyces sp. PanSC9]